MVNSPNAYRANSAQKKFYLSPEAADLLKLESVRIGMSMSLVVEQLIRKHCGKAPPKPREKRFQLNV